MLVVLFESSDDEVELEMLLLETVELLLEASDDVLDPEVDEPRVDNVVIEFVLLETVELMLDVALESLELEVEKLSLTSDDVLVLLLPKPPSRPAIELRIESR